MSQSWPWFTLACALALGPITLFRTLRFRALLGFSVPGLSWVLLTTRALNSLLPARIGEIYRIFACDQRSGCTKRRVALAVAAESAVEILSFVAIAACAARTLWPRVPSYAAFAALALALLVRPGWSKPVALTLLADLTDALMVGCCLKALGITCGPWVWCLVIVTMNLASVIPIPGNFGTMEAGVIFGLSLVGIDRMQALEFAVVYRASHLVPIWGAVGFGRMFAARRKRCFLA